MSKCFKMVEGSLQPFEGDPKVITACHRCWGNGLVNQSKGVGKGSGCIREVRYACPYHYDHLRAGLRPNWFRGGLSRSLLGTCPSPAYLSH